MSNEIITTVSGVAKVDYQGERVITLSMMDELHERPSGTAGRNFRRHRGKLLEETDYFQIDQPDEIRRLGLSRADGSTQESLILLTESGYLMLVKSFRDDLAWEVQRALVSHYFRSTEQLPSGHLLAMVGNQIAEGIRQGLDMGLKPIQQDVTRIESKVDSGFAEINQRIDKIEKRRDLTIATKRQHIDTVAAFFGGKCSCCGEVEVVDEFLCTTAEANWEHWYSPAKNRPHETWLTCRECNLRLRDDFDFKQKHEAAFKFYQMRREQKNYPLLTRE